MTKIKFNSKRYLIPILIVLIVVAVIYYGHYQNTIEIIKSEYSSKIKLIEQSIYNETKYTEIITRMIEKDIHEVMERNSKVIIDKYKKNPNVLEWDIKRLKKQLNNMDIYILDKELKIISSTIEEEIGLDLSLYNSYSEVLEKRLEGDEFQSDTINFSILEGELKKYGYIPTPDNEYLIEVSVNIKELYPGLKGLNIVYLSKSLKDEYPFIKNIKVYKFNDTKKYAHELDKTGVEPGDHDSLEKERDKRVKKSLETNEVLEYKFKNEDNNNYRLTYIPYPVYDETDTLLWWESYVIEILYNDQGLVDEMAFHRNLFLRSMAIILVFYFSSSIIILYLLQKNQEVAHSDYLTNLPNRKKFEEVMNYKILESNKKNGKMAILLIDLDKFKGINDTFGHSMGDKVLQEVASRIKSGISVDDIVSRMGGDEFTALVSDINSQEELIEIGKNIAGLLNTTLDIDSKEIPVGASVGISIYPYHGDGVEELLSNADKAMYEAKQNHLGYKIYEDFNIDENI